MLVSREPEIRHGPLERPAPLPGVDEVAEARDVRDAHVAERRKVLNGVHDDGCLIVEHGW